MTDFSRGAVQDRRATARVAPTECLRIGFRRGRRPRRPASVTRDAVRRADVGIGPYGYITRGAVRRADRGVRPYGGAGSFANSGRGICFQFVHKFCFVPAIMNACVFILFHSGGSYETYFYYQSYGGEV